MIASGCVPRTIVGQDQVRHRRPESALVADQQRVDRQEAGDRLDEVLHLDAARHRRPAQLDGEEQDQQQPPPEDRHRIAGQRDAHHAVVEHRVAAHGRDHPGGNADDQRESDGADGKLDGGREQREEFPRDGLLRDHRLAQVTVQDASDVDAVLHEHGPVQPELLAQRLVTPGSMPRSPAIVSIASPGTRRIRKNASSVIPMNVGMTSPRRVRTKRSMGGPFEAGRI